MEITNQAQLPINNELPQSAEEIPNKNSLHSYLPLRNKGNNFDWDIVVGLVLSNVLQKKIDKYDYEQFISDCQITFSEKIGEENFWPILEQMYFSNKDIFRCSPEFLLFRAQKNEYSTADERISLMFTSLLQNYKVKQFKTPINFLEQEILSVLRKKLVNDTHFQTKESPYLPYMVKIFQNDLSFLAERPTYLLSEIKHLLSFYAFIYCAQLALSINGWKKGGEPEPKPLFFIMDTEKASSERIHIKNHGYKLFNESSKNLFPFLSMLENLQKDKNNKLPLWEIFSEIHKSEHQSEITNILRNFAFAFREQRELDTDLQEGNTPEVWLENIMNLGSEQFLSSKTTRREINDKYVKEIEKQLAVHFIQRRGRAGRVLVMNQDYLLLLTNISIGENTRLQFHELLKQFKLRGVWVDKQTELALIDFYERIGNVERMSDSGDAVYVRKTV